MIGPAGPPQLPGQMLPVVRETADPMTIDPVSIGLVRLGRLDELGDLLGAG